MLIWLAFVSVGPMHPEVEADHHPVSSTATNDVLADHLLYLLYKVFAGGRCTLVFLIHEVVAKTERVSRAPAKASQ